MKIKAAPLSLHLAHHQSPPKPKHQPNKMKTPTCADRPSCDDYCPLESCVCCGLPEYSEVRKGLAFDPPIVWACHSNSKLPCTATGLNRFPDNAIIHSEPELFLKAVGCWVEEGIEGARV